MCPVSFRKVLAVFLRPLRLVKNCVDKVAENSIFILAVLCQFRVCARILSAHEHPWRGYLMPIVNFYRICSHHTSSETNCSQNMYIKLSLCAVRKPSFSCASIPGGLGFRVFSAFLSAGGGGGNFFSTGKRASRAGTHQIN